MKQQQHQQEHQKLLPLQHKDSNVTSSKPAASTISKATVVSAAGFFMCMIIMELALEGANEQFPDLEALPYAVTLFQFGCCFLLPLMVSRGKSLQTFPKTLKDCTPYISLSIIVFGSTCLASMSVRFVSYPTKVVFKSAKLIPTMMVATVLQKHGQSYGWLEYLAASLLCAGAVGYGWGSGQGAVRKTNDPSTSMIGISLLLVSVFCDAFTPNIQQRLMAPPSTGMATPTPSVTAEPNNGQTMQSFQKKLSALFLPGGGGGLGLSASALMTNANGIGCIGLLAFMLLNGSFFEATAATISHPFLLLYLIVIGTALATAVFSYTRLIQEAGSVVAVAVATLRKVATVVLSYIVFPKPMSMIHVVSAFLVLAGILLSSYAKQQRSNTNGHLR